MKKAIFLLTAFVITTSTLSAQTKLSKGVNQKEYGVQYILPKTRLAIIIKEKKTIYTPGEFCKYAEQFLKLSDIPQEATTQWNLINAKVKLTASPDSSKIFFIEMNDKSVAPLMELTSDGIIKSINLPASATPNTEAEDVPTDNITETKTVDPHSLLTEEILMSGSTAKMAELVSKEIYNIRESRSELTRGSADNLPKDGAQLKLMLDNLDIQEKALTSMFTGTYKYEEKTIILPVDIQETNDSIAFRFSTALGVVDGKDLSGRPFFLTIKDLKSINTHVEVKDNLKGIAYNMPGRALVSLKDGNKRLLETEIQATQFGTLEYLAPALFNKKSTVSVQFDSTTGGIIKVNRDEEK